MFKVLLVLLVVVACSAPGCLGATRTYYIGAKEVSWDYTPMGKNVIENRAWNADESIFTVPGPTVPQIGNVYYKCIYVEYTDSSFSVEKTRSSEWMHLGIMGPPIRAVVGDTIVVNFKNMATSNRYSIHPHGVHYLKDSEGAPYNDGTLGADKSDDTVVPGGTATYTWLVHPTPGPGPADGPSMVWLYHSHTDEVADTMAGLVGPIIITAAGQEKSNSDLSPKGVDREFVVFPNVFDESASNYINVNINAYTTVPVTGSGGGPPPYKRGIEPEPEARLQQQQRSTASTYKSSFRKSNLKTTINGYLYGNGAQHFSMNEGENVRFYVISLGSYNTEFVDSANALGSVEGFHTVRFHGHTFNRGTSFDHEQKRSQVVSVMPASMHAVDIKMVNPGTWLLQCAVTTHVDFGMSTLYTVVPRPSASTPLGLSGRTLTYYVAAEEVEWNYAPSGQDLTKGLAFSDASTDSATKLQMVGSSLLIGSTYRKAVFRRYTGPDFLTKWTSGNTDYDHLGILGPVIYAEVGDTVNVVFKNKATLPYSLNAYGAFFDKASEGLFYNDGTTGANRNDEGIPSDSTYTYVWKFPSWTGPATDDLSSVVWIYQSGRDLVADPHAGLMGPIVVSRAGSGASSGDPRPTDVGRELFVMPMMMNENLSPYLNINIQQYTSAGSSTVLANPFFPSSNWMFGINGMSYGNLPPMTSTTGLKTRVNFFSLGSIDGGIHAIHFHGQSYGEFSHIHKDIIEMLPGLTRNTDLSPQNPGRFKVECHSYAHGFRGMDAFFDVQGSAITQGGSSTTRTYYIAADEVIWNYAPLGKNNITNRNFGAGPDSRETWLIKSAIHLGPQALKAVYRQYTDDTFLTLEPVPDAWKHLGIMGPPIRAVVGDTIKVVFKNNARYPFSIHPQGLLYTKSNEGDGTYLDGDNGPDNVVNPNQVFTYTWYVPASAGPGSSDPSSIAWAYYSRSTLAVNQVDAGLIGPIIITAAGQPKSSSNLSPKGVDREFVSLYSIFRESESPYWLDELAQFGLDPAFQETGSDQRSTINGYMYGNAGNFNMDLFDNVRWYILSTGSFDGVHTPHWHGITVVETGHRTDVTELLPTSTRTVDIVADNPGTWLAHCHVSDHMATGMIHLFSIAPSSTNPPPSSDTSAAMPAMSFSIFLFFTLVFMALII